ncbi:MAG: CBS domain-containing protein [Patescibacteria group bacterium]|nr:CBS domain-containing protein [Patescibacteria group bacterium]
MITEYCTAKKDMTILEAVKLMVEKKTNSLIVIDENNHPIGTLSSYTLVKEVVPPYLQDDPIFSNFGAEGTFNKYAEKMKDNKIEAIMHKDFHALSINDAMIEAASYATKGTRRILPVISDDGAMVGVITRTCIKNALYNALFEKDQIDARNGGNK